MANARWIATLTVVLALGGCLPPGGGGSSGGDGGTPPDNPQIDGAAPTGDAGADDAELAPDVPPSPPGAPRVLSLDSDRHRLTEGQSMRISAVVTDDDGVEDVLGGVLEDPQGGAYGPFTAAGAGTYRIDVGWAALHGVAPITFVGESERVLWARFFDQAGLETVEALRVTLFCDGEGAGACDGVCMDLSADVANCGGCGIICPAVGDAAPACVDGVCVGDCSGAGALCAGACVDLATDSENCGDCGVVCPPIAGGEAICDGGQCGGSCPGGGRACGAACVDVSTDGQHCGDCGIICPGDPGQQRCVDGRCLAPCADHESVCADACVDLDADPENCGDCGRVCPAPIGGSGLCLFGECVDGCPPGQQSCDMICIDVLANPEHCGGCFDSCPGGFSCIDGGCVLECPDGRRACDGECARCPTVGVAALGCEADACVATRCAEGFDRFDGGCAPRVTEQIYEVPIAEPQVGAYPPIAVDLTVNRDGLPYLMVGRLSSDGRVTIEAGPRNPEFGWNTDLFNVFDTGRAMVRVGAVLLPDGRVVHGWAYGRGDRSDLIGGGMKISEVGAPEMDLLPGNLVGDVWGFSVAGRIVDGALRAQMGISLNNRVNRSMGRNEWQDGSLELIDPFIDGIVHFTLDAQGEVHFVHQPDYGGALTWQRGTGIARVSEPVGEPAALLGGVRVGPRGPVVSYARDPDTQLRVATRQNGRWVRESVDPADQGGQFWGFDVELDPEGWPVACYWRNQAIYVARQGPDGWTRRRVAGVEGGQTECAVAIDGAGGVSVLWTHYVTEGDRTTATLHYDGLAPGLP